MNKEFIPYEQALALKELGFDEPCFGFHSKIHGLILGQVTGTGPLFEQAGECSAPLYQQAFRWLFEKRGIKGCMIMDDTLDDVLRNNIKLLKEKNND